LDAVAERLRVVHGRKRAGKKRPPKRKRGRGLRWLALAGLAALILGFLAKRVMIPSAVHYIVYRPPDHPPSSEANPPATSEQLTPSDRSKLNAIIKDKSK
jgi:hypothetical protein